jgi:GTPase SAR1 family protein
MKKLKLIILGNKKVGKTKILNQLIGATFEIESQMITSPDKVIKKVKIKNNELLLLEI